LTECVVYEYTFGVVDALAELDEIAPKTSMPGGEYDAEQNPDGSWNIGPFPWMPVHEARGTRKDGSEFTFAVTEEWLRRALEIAQARARDESYLGPAHENHGEARRRPAGRILATSVEPFVYQGETRPWLHGRLMYVPEAQYARIRSGELIYASPEVLSFAAGEVDSLALMSDVVPAFRGPPITIGRETPHPLARKSGVGKVYRAIAEDGDARVYACPSEEESMPHQRTSPPAGARMQAPKAEEDENEDELEQGLEGPGEGGTPPPPPESLPETAPAEQPAEEELTEEEKSAKMAATPRAGASYAAQLGALQASNRKLEKQLAALQRERAVEKLVASTVAELTSFGMDAAAVEADARKYAAQGDGALTIYRETAKKTALARLDSELAPPAEFTDIEGTQEGLEFLAGASSSARTEGAKYAAEHDNLVATGFAPTMSRADYVRSNLIRSGQLRPNGRGGR
jgi:hypothetical protein